MKFEIDTDNKTIKLTNTTKIGELIDTLTKLGLDWRDFNIEVTHTIEYRNSPFHPNPIQPVYPYTDRPSWIPDVVYTVTSDPCGIARVNINTINDK